jgi:DNA-binding MarR family transcriptional regulator
MKKTAPIPAESSSSWTFFTNHAHVLICLAANPEMRLRAVADKVGITERAVQKIVADLESGGILTREKSGRCNTYTVHGRLPLRHPIEAHCTVQGLIGFIVNSAPVPPQAKTSRK